MYKRQGLDREKMTQCLEKVRRDMAEQSRVYPDTQLSYAVGFALACDFPGSTMRELFNCADKNMVSSLTCQCVFLISPVSVPARQDLSVLLCAVWLHPCVAVQLSASQ